MTAFKAATRPVQTRWTADRYRSDYQWQVDTIDGQVMLSFGSELVGIAVNAGRGGEINHQLVLHRMTYPVLRFGEPRGRWVFLATNDFGHLPSVPWFVALLRAGHRMALPPSRTATGELDWIVPPDRCAAGVPRIEPLMAVVRSHAP